MKVVGFGGFTDHLEDFELMRNQLPQQYQSPEIKQRAHFNAHKADMWALGICFLQLGTSHFCTGQETVEQLAQQAASLGPQLGALLQLVFTDERDRPDFLQFKELSGYCQRCWDNIDKGESLCGNCPTGSRSVNPKPVRSAESFPPKNPVQIEIPQRVQQIYRQVVRERSPEPPKCRNCNRPLTKINEKDICRLCLSDPKRSPLPVPVPQQPVQSAIRQSPQPVVQPFSQPKPFPLPAARPLSQPPKGDNPKPSFIPQKPGGKNWENPAGQNQFQLRPVEAEGRALPRGAQFPQLGGSGQEEERGEGSCISCHKWLPKIPHESKGREGYEGYDEMCPKCAEAQMEFELTLTSNP